jgi:glutathione S-transferase
LGLSCATAALRSSKNRRRTFRHSKRQKWLKAYHRFPQQDIDEARAKISYAVARMEQALAEHPYLAGQPIRSPTSTCSPRPSGCRAERRT